MKNITDAMLFRFFAEQTTLEETDLISAWINEDPVQNQKILDKAYDLYVLSIMAAPNNDSDVNNLRLSIFTPAFWFKVLRYAGVAAAVILIAVGVGYGILNKQTNKWLQQQTTVDVPAGQHIRLTLSDGSVVELNAQSRLVYPAIFPKSERRVCLSGEAIFNVSHNPDSPFIVETFSCDVGVFGTHFDVMADEEQNYFSTTLFDGKVAVTDKADGKSIVLQPNDVVRLQNGEFKVSKLKGRDDYLWMDGIISMTGIPFDQLMRKLERTYNVKIEIRRETLPDIKYKSLKVRVSDGIDHALKMLQLASDFNFEYDKGRCNGVIIIR